MARNRDLMWLVVLWLVVTSYNLMKPYHIDDAAYLIISAWILHHPLHPMSGPLNWSGTVQPIYETNQPHLYFYALAGWEKMFGFSEIALHSLQSLFSAACIALFYIMAQKLARADALWLTAMLALNPAFIVEQNLMVDVPLLSCWLGFFACLLCGVDSPRQNQRYALIGVACSAAILVKYSSLVLIPILLIALLLERRHRQAWCLVIPVAALAAWSAFNLFDYGGIHLLTGLRATASTYKPPGTVHKHLQFLHEVVRSNALWKVAKFGISWCIGLGALTPLGLIALGRRFPRLANPIYLVCLAGLIAISLAVAWRILPDHAADRILSIGFALNAVVLLFFILRPVRDLTLIYLETWIVLTSLFYIVASPFIAARHLLLILPAISLLIACSAQMPRAGKRFGLIITIIVSAGLCVSDFRFADFYKSEAAAIRASLPAKAVVWAAGHWGWQYYATKAGMREIDVGARPAGAIARCTPLVGPKPGSVTFLEEPPATRLPSACANLGVPNPNESSFQPADYLIVPTEVDHQLPTDITIRLVRTVRQRSWVYDPFCTGRPARFYAFSGANGPWSLSANCEQDIDIFQIQ